MKCVCASLFLVIPPRLQIPGAILAQSRPAPFRQQRVIADNYPPPQRVRRPIPNAIPLREVRPVIEENEDSPLGNPSSSFDDEVNKLGLAALSSARAEAAAAASAEEEEQDNRPLPFRPERPVPVSREQIREKPQQIYRQEAPRPAPRPIIRQEIRDEQPIRQPIRQQTRTSLPPPPPPRQIHKRPQSLDDEEDPRLRGKKPEVQILSKYRTDNDDGSISWGFENDDGTFKEETLGTDCIIRGKYGYVDPDGVRREYSYEAGNKCDEPEEEEELADLPAGRPNIPQQAERRPLPTQYSRA